MRHIYLSSHFDDAVFSCGGLIDRQVQRGETVVVITVFAGQPAHNQLSPIARRLHAEWGLEHDAPQFRAEEDRRALALLGAELEHWEFADSIYRCDGEESFRYTDFQQLFRTRHPADQPLVEQIAERVIERCRGREQELVLYAPLAIGHHVDHTIVEAAAWLIFERDIQLLFYEDQPYISNTPEQLGWALFPRPKIWWEPMVVSIDLGRKLAAASCYASQTLRVQGCLAHLESYARRVSENGAPVERLWRPRQRQIELFCDTSHLLVCPRCRAGFARVEVGWRCQVCEHIYPTPCGIADLRTGPSMRFVHVQRDLERAQQIEALERGAQLAAYAPQVLSSDPVSPQSPVVPSVTGLHEQAARLLGSWLALPQRIGASWLPGIGVEIGCGFGEAILSLSSISPFVIGISMSLSQLVRVRHILEEQGLSETTFFVAGCPDVLPLADASVANIVACNVYEQIVDRTMFLHQAHRALQTGGHLLLHTTSRFAWREPYTQLWGLGYLPRTLQPHVVRLAQGRQYNIALPSLWELQHSLHQSLPAQTPFAIKTREPLSEGSRVSWKKRILHQVPGARQLVNSLYAHTGCFEVVVGKHMPRQSTGEEIG